MARLTKTMRGLLVHAFEQISEDTLNTIDSSYTEAGAQPGDAIAADSTSKLQPEVSAAQNEGLELY